MKAHELAKLLMEGPNLPVVAENRDWSCEITGVKIELTTFWGPEGENDPRERDRLGYPEPAECVFVINYQY